MTDYFPKKRLTIAEYITLAIAEKKKGNLKKCKEILQEISEFYTWIDVKINIETDL